MDSKVENKSQDTDRMLVGAAISLVISCIFFGITAIGSWNGFSLPLEEIARALSVSHSVLVSLLVIEAAGFSLLFVSTACLIIMFFKRDSRTPRYFILLCIVSLVFVILDTVLASSIGINDIKYSIQLIVGNIIYCVIWIPYFSRSEHVKNTFVRKIA